MTAIQLHITPAHTPDGLAFQYLHIQISTPTGLIEATDLKDVTLPREINWRQGVVIDGKAPIWLYGYLVHECHPAAWVGCYDPRLGAVVVATHTPAIATGTVLDIQTPT